MCHELHLRQRNGNMSIHDDERGVRCAGSNAEPPRPPAPTAPKYKRGTITPPDVLATELEEAFAAIRRKGFPDQNTTSTPFDRRIYATKGVQQVVRGGDSGHGRRS